jgi:predicted NUDIX family NTP pyrophosphohydrolase
MSKVSVGLLVYRIRGGRLEVFLVHPGGPFWVKKDLGAWSIPKGEPEPGEDLLSAAQREFEEETSFKASGQFSPLTPAKPQSGKVVHAWAVEGDCDAEAITSNMFSMEWPPRSGRQQEFPEVDRAAWFELKEAKKRINKGQTELLEELARLIGKNREYNAPLQSGN